MTHTPAPPRFGPVTLHGPRRRRRVFVRRGLVVTLALIVGLLAAAAAAVHYLHDDKHRAYLSTNGWPIRGEGAYRLGHHRPAVGPDERPVPIASLAKVMTAYLVLQHFPMHSYEAGRDFVVRQADVTDTARRRAEDQSVVSLEAGERLTERDALMAMLLPSANNVAVLVARDVSGSVAAFVAEMNATAREFGMAHTVYTDPSGYDAGTVSTALDQLRLAEVVADDPTLADIMATRSYSLPGVGEIHNTNTLLGSDGFVGMKTGSDDAAGGCFMFRTRRQLRGHAVDLVGVVLGQPGHNLIDAGLYAAEQLADRIAPKAAS